MESWKLFGRLVKSVEYEPENVEESMTKIENYLLELTDEIEKGWNGRNGAHRN